MELDIEILAELLVYGGSWLDQYHFKATKFYRNYHSSQTRTVSVLNVCAESQIEKGRIQ